MPQPPVSPPSVKSPTTFENSAAQASIIRVTDVDSSEQEDSSSKFSVGNAMGDVTPIRDAGLSRFEAEDFDTTLKKNHTMCIKPRTSLQNSYKRLNSGLLDQNNQFMDVNNKSEFKYTIKKSIQVPTNALDCSDDAQMSFEIREGGKMTLFVIASMYLNKDLDYGMLLTHKAEQIKKSNFLFLGNCYRLHALFLEQLYERDLFHGKVANDENIRKIERAVLHVKKALQVFSNSGSEKSTHGTALSLFHLGYLYHKYAE